MIKVDISKGVQVLKQLGKELSEENVEKAQVRAINRTLNSSRAAVAKEIRKVYNIGAAHIKDAMEVEKAKRGQLYGWVMLEGKPLPMVQFKASMTKKGVAVTIMKGKRKVLPGTFFAVVSGRTGQHRGIFAKGKYGSGGGSFKSRRKRVGKLTKFTQRGEALYPDLPITELHTVSIPEAFANKNVILVLQGQIEAAYLKRLETEVKYILGKLKPA